MKIKNPRIIRLLARSFVLGCKLLMKTCRIEIREAAPMISPFAPTGDERYIYCVWHDGIVGDIFSGRPLNCSALTSRHRDGEYVATIMRAVGIKEIRGSHSHGGAAAIRQMMDLAADYHVVVATDGPRGPRRQVKPGIIFLASHSGRRIVPVAFAAKRFWAPKGKWTDLVVPVPFTKAYMMGGEPFSVPQNLSKDELGPYCEELQRRMDTLQAEADALAGHSETAEMREAAFRRAA